MRRIGRVFLAIGLALAAGSFTLVTTGCPDATGPNCKIGCRCGRSCIDCSKTCHKVAAYYWSGAVPDSLKP